MGCAKWLTVALCAQGALVASAPRVASLDIGLGYRLDDFKFSGSSTGLFGMRPFSVDFSDMQMIEAAGLFETNRCSPFFFSLLGKHGWILSGSGEETLSIDGRLPLGELVGFSFQSEANAVSLGGDTNDLEGKIGCRFHFCGARGFIAPVIGATYHKFHVFGSKSSTNLLVEALGQRTRSPLDALPLQMTADLRGVLVGFEGDYQFFSHWNLSGGLAWNWFKSKTLTHTGGLRIIGNSSESASPQGINSHLDLFYKDPSGWEFGLQSAFRYIYATGGHGNTSFTLDQAANMDDPRTIFFFNAPESLAHFHWSSFSLQLMAGYRF